MKITYSLSEFFPVILGYVNKRKRSILMQSGKFVKITLLHRLMAAQGFHKIKCHGCGTQVVEVEEHPIFNKKNKHIKSYITFNTSNNSILTIDHIIPKSMGGSNKFQNLQMMCRDCNGIKNDRLICEYKKIYSMCDIHYHIRGKYPDHPHINDLMEHHVDVMSKHWNTEEYLLDEIGAIGYLSFLNDLFEFEVSLEELKYELIPKEN